MLEVKFTKKASKLKKKMTSYLNLKTSKPKKAEFMKKGEAELLLNKENYD
jgi:hypothetical protein